jgi:hypothetical protein
MCKKLQNEFNIPTVFVVKSVEQKQIQPDIEGYSNKERLFKEYIFKNIPLECLFENIQL